MYRSKINMRRIYKILIWILLFLFSCFLVSQAQSEVWEIREEIVEYDTIFSKKGHIKKIIEGMSWDYLPIRLSDTLTSEERLNRYGGFVYVEKQTIASLLQKYTLPTNREFVAVKRYLPNLMEELDMIIFVTEVDLDYEIWDRNELLVTSVLPKNYVVQDRYEKYIQPRDGYTRIVEKKKVPKPVCMMHHTHKEYGIVTYGMITIQKELSGWIFVTSPKEVY